MGRIEDKFHEEICDKYFKDVYQFCKYITKYSEKFSDIAEDCAQETFLQAKMQIEKLINHPNVKGWLYITAKNLINNSVRKHYTKDKYELALYDEIACSSISVEDELEKSIENGIDVDKLKKEVIKQLSIKDYELYKECFIKKTPIVEIAERQNISISAIYTRIHRLKIKIKTIAKEVIRDEFDQSKI